MEILHDLIKMFTPNVYNIYDSLSITTVSIETKYIGINIDEIYICLEKFPLRDLVELKLKFSVDDVITISQNRDMQTVKESIEELHHIFLDEEIDVFIEIQKSGSDNCISIYCIDKFNEWLLSKNYKEIMQLFSEPFKNGKNSVRFICFDFEGILATNTISFVKPDNENIQYSNEINRQEVICNSRKICNFYNHSEYGIIPDDFQIVFSSKADKKIIDLFNNINIFLSLIYISDISDLDDNNINITVKGYKTIDYKIELDSFEYKDNQKVLFDIYKWLYNGGNVYDKSQLARNIMTLHCKYSTILELDEKTFASITANYGLYLKENVNNYLNVKKDITTFVQSNIQEVTKAISSFNGDLKKNFFAFFSYFATLIVSSSFAKLKVKDIFTSEVTTITSFILVGSLIFWMISLFEVLSKYLMMNKSTNSLKESYSDILDTVEIQNIIDKDKSLIPSKNRFRLNLIIISILWILMITGLFLALDDISGKQQLLFKFNIFS